MQERNKRESYIIKADGASYPVSPSGSSFTLKELYGYIDTDMVEFLTINKDYIMVVDEEGRLKSKPYNDVASDLIGCVIVGDVLVCKKKMIR